MIYIIISNVGMAIMMIFVYFRYSRFRISSAIEIKKLRAKSEEQAEEMKNSDRKLLQATKTDNDKIQSLLREIDELRKEKENEIKLRLNAETQIELTLQKTAALEKKMEDWHILQDSLMHDSKDAIFKIGNDLYKKLSDSYKQEAETNKNLIARISKTVSDFADKFSSPFSTASSKEKVKVIDKTLPDKDGHQEVAEPHAEDPAKKLISDLVSTMKAGGYLVNKDYFTPANFDDQKAKLMLCELAFLRGKKLYLIDFKACRYLAEYQHLRDKNKIAAETSLKQKLDKYFSYLGNTKYRGSILKAMLASKVKFEKTIIAVVVSSRQDLQILKEVHYDEKARRFGFEVMDFDGANNIVL